MFSNVFKVVFVFFICLLLSIRLSAFVLESEKFYDRWDSRISIISPLVVSYLSNVHINMLMSIYEDDFITKESKGVDLGVGYFNVDEDWRNKYLSLLSFLSSSSSSSGSSSHVITEDYSDYEGKYKKPIDYNLVVVLEDSLSPEQDRKSYCVIYIDKKQKAETNIAFLSQKKLAKLKVSPVVKHRLGVIKFVLNEKKNKWERQINLVQPSIKYFTIPKDRIRVIEIFYDAYKESPDTAHLKYKYTTYFLREGSYEY